MQSSRDDSRDARSPGDDAALVRAATDGDRSAFAALVERHQRKLFYTALRYVHNDADAADITQRAFLRAYRGLHRFRGDAAFTTWLHRIAINLSLNHIRDNRRERPAEIPEDSLTQAPVGANRVESDERARALRDAIDQLPPKQKMVLELRIYDELPFKEVARLAACSENSAKVNFHHAVKRLKELMAAARKDDTR